MERVKIDLTKFLENIALIHYKKDSLSEKIKYKDLLKQTLKVGVVLEGENVSRSESVTVGILCKKSPASVSLILAMLEADLAFCFISEQDIPHELDKLGIKYFFSDENLFDAENFVILRNSLDVFGTKIRLYKSTSVEPIRLFEDYNDPMNRICYTITTSGTIQRKIVRVTYNCIAPNVVNLQQIFRLNKDVIYSSAPCTFDVFVLDLFLALHSGSALMLMDDTLRYSDESLNVMFSLASIGVTFLQITPSLFQQYGIYNIKEKILHPDSSLK
jgi:acyl-CoA synthetase